jgi:glucose-1-phosphate thymidylyltransferase
MKGVILAGGLGSRLMPCTRITNKHLLPVYDQPMIYYPIQTLKAAGITDIFVVTGPEHVEDFKTVLGDGSELGVKLSFKTQDKPGGIAQALGMAKEFVGNEKFAAILGDNIFEDETATAIKHFATSSFEAFLFLKAVPDAIRFGVATVEGQRIVKIVEKPTAPESNLAVTGLYLYDGSTVFSLISTLKPSARGELEITDVNNYYVQQGKAGWHQLQGDWTDAGTFESLYKAAHLARKKKLGKAD